jgi:colanic acid biosynthesis glycosyl transferase WcaI
MSAKSAGHRILVYGINYAPELVGIGKYTGELCEWLAKQGHQVKVITAPPYYPYWAVQKPYRGWRYKKETLNGVGVYRCPIWVPGKASWLKRLVHLVSFAVSSAPVLLLLLRWRPQVLFAVEPTVFSVMVAAIVARFAKLKSWLHVQDLEMDAALSLQLVSDRRMTRLMLSAERRAMRSFDRVSSISNAMIGRLHAKYVDPTRTTLLLNWVDIDCIQPLDSTNSLRREWGIDASTPVILYSGNLGHKQGLELVLDVAKVFRVLRPEVLFLMVGDGVAREYLQASASRHALPNIIFKPLQPREKLAALLSTADIHLVLQRKGAADLVMPSKLSGIWAAGGAVLVTCEPGTELHTAVAKNDLGLVIAPDSAEALADGLERLLDDPVLRKNYQTRARSYVVRELEKEVVLSRFETALTQLISPESAASNLDSAGVPVNVR